MVKMAESEIVVEPVPNYSDNGTAGGEISSDYSIYSYIAIGCVTVAMGILAYVVISYIDYKARLKENGSSFGRSGGPGSLSKDTQQTTSAKDPSPPTPAKLKSVIRQVLSPTSAKASGDSSGQSSASSSIPSHKNPKYQSECINTIYNLDDFMIRLYKTGFVVKRVKPGEKKVRCLKIDSRGRLCLYKQFEEKEIVIPIGKPYMRFELYDLMDTFICEEDNKAAFILEFKEKTLLFTCPLALDANYLVEGFKNLIFRLKMDREYLDYCVVRYQEIRPGGNGSSSLSKHPIDHDDESIATASTYNTAGTTYSWSSRNGQRNITRIK